MNCKNLTTCLEYLRNESCVAHVEYGPIKHPLHGTLFSIFLLFCGSHYKMWLQGKLTAATYQENIINSREKNPKFVNAFCHSKVLVGPSHTFHSCSAPTIGGPCFSKGSKLRELPTLLKSASRGLDKVPIWLWKNQQQVGWGTRLVEG